MVTQRRVKDQGDARRPLQIEEALEQSRKIRERARRVVQESRALRKRVGLPARNR